ncbi:MAG TPA: aminotransferase class V-fold PLP-dependent enzyme [Intrasporangium sp.]|uniref:aminotransferase class V-fold PLP-dependent enzyme n=1 Tax=Intrasporangium sp. TaxID=1925024 RepID=UPI002B45F59F|nr:aminotransferase class V-fold PLP-dependent enzyme [Intrasporangium sp.]HKX66750.1 aminotransferase class V-fold PLP-dependent enzyme [Intrasporangium sp.]
MSVIPSTPTSTCSAPAPLLHSRPRVESARTEGPALPAVVGAELQVPTLSGGTTYANLDHAASTPALVAAKEAVDRALETYASVHRGAGHASRLTSAWYEQARAQVAEFVGARADDSVVFTRTTTDSWALLSSALPAATTVFVFASEHHSTLLPWGDDRTVRLPVPRSVEEARSLLGAALARARSVDRDGERLVVVTAASNVTGEVWPIEELARVARVHGARIAVDAAQLSGHRPIDLAGWDVDYVAFSGHKTYAPFGAGVLAGRSDWLDAGTPYLRGGGATRTVGEHGTSWATGPARHEGGSPNVIGAIALAAACATIARHREAIEAHEARLLARLRNGLRSIEGVEQLSAFGDGHDRVGVVAFTVRGLEPSLVSQVLSVEHGIGVRDGRFCAHLLVDDLLADARVTGDTLPGGGLATAVRASIGLGTTVEAVDRLIGAVRELVEAGPAATWSRGDTGWVVSGNDPRDREVARPW